MFFETGMDGISPHGIFYHDIIISEPQCNIIMIVNMYTTQKFGGKIKNRDMIFKFDKTEFVI